MDRRDFMKLTASTSVVMVLPNVGLALPIVGNATIDPYAGKRGCGYISAIIPISKYRRNLHIFQKNHYIRDDNLGEYFEVLSPLLSLKVSYAAHQIMDVDSGKLLKSRHPDEYMDLQWLEWHPIIPQFKSSTQWRAS